MRFHPLSAEQKEYLELRHRYEGDKRVADRIKAVLLKNEGWKNKAIAQALRIHDETVRYYITDWTSDEKLKPENGGSYSKLDSTQSCQLERHLEETTVAFFDQLKAAYPAAPNIHIILDQSGYHRSLWVRDEALKRNIVLHYLPPYSPNLNLIERLWKVMNEEVRNNVFFNSAKHFCDAIAEFFDTKISKIAQSLRERINDSFQIINPVPSS